MLQGRFCRVVFSVSCLVCGALGRPSNAQESPKADKPVGKQEARTSAALPPSVVQQARRAITRGLGYLRTSEDREGGWTSNRYGPAVTALVAQGFARDSGYGPKHPVVERALVSILKFEQTDGGIYDKRQNLANYQSSVVLSFLASLEDPALKDRMQRMQAFLSGLQYEQSESIDESHPWYGGAGYNSTKRPDLSNTQMMLEALHASGLPKDSPVYQRALKFVTRCQMNEATNDMPYAKGSSDGGFIYSTNNGGESKANPIIELTKSQRISYGSMTYAGFKSMLYANVERDDPRIKACLKWIRANYSVDVNPGLSGGHAEEGLYYYLHVFSKALAAWGEPIIVDDKGVSHNWRVDLIRKLATLQQADGSWVNEKTRWLEGDENYVTAIAVLALEAATETDSSKVH